MDAEKVNHSNRAMWPYKLAVMLLYKTIPGATPAKGGMLVVHFSELRRSMGRAGHYSIANDLLKLKEMGIVDYLQLHKTFALVGMAAPQGMSKELV